MTDTTSSRIGAGFGAAVGFFLGGAASLMASGWIVGKRFGTYSGDQDQNLIGIAGAALGAVVGAAVGVPSVEEPQLKTGVSGLPVGFP